MIRRSLAEKKKRLKRVLQMRQERRTFAEIGRELDISPTRAQQMHAMASRAQKNGQLEPEPLDGLSVFAINMLKDNFGNITPEALEKMLPDLVPGGSYGLGKSTINEIRRWFGWPELQEAENPRVAKAIALLESKGFKVIPPNPK